MTIASRNRVQRDLLCGLLLVGLLSLPAKAGWAPPPEALALEDGRMASWSAGARSPVPVTGRIRNLPPEDVAGLAISGSLVLAGPRSQVAMAVPVMADGTFRLELPATFPCQQMWLRVGRFFYAGLLVRGGVHVEIDAAGPTARLSGPDGPLNEEVRAFQFRFEKKRQDEIDRRMRDLSLARDAAADLGGVLGQLEALHQESRALLEAFAPREAGYLLASDLDAQLFSAALRAARGRERELMDAPLWGRLARHETWAMTNEQTAFYRALHGYLRGLCLGGKVPMPEILASLGPILAPAPPEARAAHAAALALCDPHSAATPEFKAALSRLSSAGWLSAAPAVVDGVQARAPESLPATKREFALVFAVPADAAEAVLAHAALDRALTVPWIRTLLRDQDREAEKRLAAVNAALGAASLPTAAAPLGEPMKRLPAGAQLHRWPELGGRAVLDRIRAAYPGRALLLDFWGPWCAPCLEDLPHSRALHTALKDRPIEFVYFACRTDPGAWQRSVADLGLAGTHVFLEPAQTAELMALFGLGGFPGYAFLDRNGQHHPGVVTRLAHSPAETIEALLRR